MATLISNRIPTRGFPGRVFALILLFINIFTIFCSYGKRVINWSKTSLIALSIRSILPRWKTALTLKRNFPAQNRTNWQSNNTYRKTSDIRHTLVDNKIVDHSDVVRASPVGAAPTASSFSTWHLASRDSAKKAARQYENILSVRIWCV